MANDLILRTDSVSKRYCRSLRRSLWYGVCDVGRELFVRMDPDPKLRPDEFWAVDGISFELRRGECLGLVGRNGAGKTTLLKLLNGLIKPDRGNIELWGRVGALIALGAGFNPILTGRENVYANGAVLGRRKREIDQALDRIIDFAEIGEFIDSPVQSYSSGMQVRLGFAIAAELANPELLLLDEVLAVGDASFQTKCINTIKRLLDDGVAIILVSHNMHNLFRYCNRGLYMRHGKVVASGDIVQVSNRYLQDQVPATDKAEAGEDDGGNVPTGSPFVLDRIEVVNEHGYTATEIEPLEPIQIRAPWSLTGPYPAGPIHVEIAVDDLNGLFYQDVSDPIDFPGGKQGDAGHFVTSFDGIRVNSGRLNVGIALWNQGKSQKLGWSRNNFLIVHNKKIQAGRGVINPRWHFQTGARLSR